MLSIHLCMRNRFGSHILMFLKLKNCTETFMVRSQSDNNSFTSHLNNHLHFISQSFIKKNRFFFHGPSLRTAKKVLFNGGHKDKFASRKQLQRKVKKKKVVMCLVQFGVLFNKQTFLTECTNAFQTLHCFYNNITAYCNYNNYSLWYKTLYVEFR